MRRAIFRCDASHTLGSGHVMRCLTLAGALTASGWHCEFVVGPDSVATVPALKLSSFPLHAPMSAVGPADLLVVDHYQLDARFESACRAWAGRILVIDDLADRLHDCDCLLDQSFGRDAADYRGRVPASSDLLIGTRYALLRPEFAERREDALRRREARTLQRIFVSFGGTDPFHLAERASEAIRASRLPDCRIDRVDGRSSAAAMADLMEGADLALGAAGTTSWERCCLGLPALIVITANNQRLVADHLAEAGAARILGWHEEVTVDSICRAIDDIAGDLDSLTGMAARAAQLCDGMGAARVVERIEKMYQ